MKHSLVLAVASVALLAGCSEGNVSVDTSLAQSTALAGADQVGTSIQLPAVAGGQDVDQLLIIDSVQISTNELEIEGDEDAGEEYETSGDRTVEVALDGATNQIFGGSVPTGTYKTLGMQFHITDFGGTPASIYVQGTYMGNPFTYGSTMSPEIEFYLDNPVEVTEGADAAVSVSFDVAAWFQGADGIALDPTLVENRNTIENTILNTMTANAAEVEWGEDGDED